MRETLGVMTNRGMDMLFLGLPDKANRDELSEVAKKIIRLIFSSKKWINRRVDSVSFTDPMTITRCIGVDINPPKGDELPILRGMQLIPIAMIRKGDLINFVSQDEASKSWALCTLSETREIERAMLKQWGYGFRVVFPDSLIDDVIYFEPSPSNGGDFSRILFRFREIMNPDKGSKCDKEGNDAALVLVKMLARNRIILARLIDKDAPGKIFKFSYDRTIVFDEPQYGDLLNYRDKSRSVNPCDADDGRNVKNTGATQRQETSANPSTSAGNALQNAWQKALSCLSERKYPTLIIAASNSSYACNYHFEMTAPDGVAITSSALYNESNYTYCCPPNRTRSTRCDLHSKNHKIATGTRGRAFIEVAPIRHFWMTAACAASSIVGLLLLVVGAFWMVGVTEDSGNALSALLVSLAGVLFTVVMKPDEKSFSRHLTRPMRRLALTCAGAAGLSITLGYSFISIEARWSSWLGGTVALIGGGFSLCIAFKHFTFWKTSVPPLSLRKEKPKNNTEVRGVEQEGSRVLSFLRDKTVYYQPMPPPAGEGEGGLPTCDYYEHEDMRDSRVQSRIEKAVQSIYPRKEEIKDWWVNDGMQP